MLEARGLTKRYLSIPAVENVSFTLSPGEILGYLGPNGSGKSTTVKMLTGLIEPSEGELFYQGENVRGQFTEFKRKLGYVPEEAQLYPHLTGFEYLQLIGRLRGMPGRTLDAKVGDFLKLFGIYDARFTQLGAYSKGMRQKILLSQALLANPEILIFDEPFSGLDVNAALMFRTLLQALAAEGKLILYSSHVLEVVQRVCSRVLILSKGRVVANNSIERLRDLMSLESLEDVFAQLTQQEDVAPVAAQIIEAMKA